MKKNVFLVGVLVTLLALIYFVAYSAYDKSTQKAIVVPSDLPPPEIKTVEAKTPEIEKPSVVDTILETLSLKEKEPEKIPEIPREATPVRGIYVSAPAMNSPKVRARILNTLETTRINALVIDVKDSSGYVFLPIVEDQYKFTESAYSQNAQDFIKEMKAKGVYLMARIVVFQDPLLVKQFPEYALKNKDGSIWRDRKGMAFLDPQNKAVWDHTMHLSTATHEFGFDEINFDYIRYPSDGKISDIAYNMPEGKTKSDMMEKFFAYAHEELRVKKGIYISADIFGDAVRLKGDPGVGQIFEKTLPYFDAVAPMVYPSHFSPGSYGMKDPDSAPKEIMEGTGRDMPRRLSAWCPVVAPVTETMKEKEIVQAQAQYEMDMQKMCSPWKNRPWIQDFSLHMDYGVKEVKDQIDALERAGITSWLVWNPSSRYTTEAFK